MSTTIEDAVRGWARGIYPSEAGAALEAESDSGPGMPSIDVDALLTARTNTAESRQPRRRPLRFVRLTSAVPVARDRAGRTTQGPTTGRPLR